MATAAQLTTKIHTLQEKITPAMKEKVNEVRVQIFHHASHAHHGLLETDADYKKKKQKADAECAAYEKKLWSTQPKDVQFAHTALAEIDKLEKEVQKMRGVIFV